MFIGHFGAGLAAKKIDNKPSLGTLFIASQFIDLLWPVFILLGIEKVKIEPGNTAFTPLDFSYYPFSHSFLGVLVWSVLFGIVYYLFRKNFKSSVLLGCLVMSHWILDLVTHRPDLQITPWGDLRVGLGLWYSVPLTIVIEGLIFAAGIYFYFRSTKAKNKKGSIGIWSLLIFFVLIYFMNIVGAPPPDDKTIAVAGMFQWLFIIWAYWADKNREQI